MSEKPLLEVSRRGDILVGVLQVTELLGPITAKQILTEILTSLEQRQQLLLDFSMLEKYDAGWSAAAFVAARQAGTFRSRIWIAGLQPTIRKAFELQRLCSILDFYDSVDQALGFAAN